MKASEAKSLTATANPDGKIKDIMCKIEEAAKLGKLSVTHFEPTTGQIKALRRLGYAVEFNPNCDEFMAVISWNTPKV